MKAKSFEQIGVESQIFEESFTLENAILPSKIQQLYPFQLQHEAPSLEAAPLKRDHLSLIEKIASGLTSLIATAFAFVINFGLGESKKQEFMSRMWFD